MKIRMTKHSKETFTVAEMPIVRRIIEAEKEDEWTPEALAVYAMGVFDHFKGRELKNKGYYAPMNGWKIYDAGAEMCKNARVWDWYGQGTEHVDVWISWIAVNEYYGAVECGICMSDVHSISCEADDNEEIYSNMYIHEYKPMKREH